MPVTAHPGLKIPRQSVRAGEYPVMPLHPILRALPLTALNDALRAVMLDGSALATLAMPLGVLGLWTVGSFLVALRVFRWE